MQFGTDGVRGVALTELTTEFATRLGRAAARVLGPGDVTSVVVGGDTRESTEVLDRALCDGFALEGFASSATMDVQVDELDVTTLGSAGWRQRITGLATHTIAVTGFQDYDATGVDPTLTGTGTGQNVITFCPINGGATVADPCFFGAGRTTTRTPISGAVGDPAGFSLDWTGDGRLVRG